MSWISKHLGIHLDSHTLPNLLKNASPLAAFTPLGLAGTFGASVLGDLGRGKNIREAAIGGAENAAIGSGLRSGVGALRSALSSGTPAAAPAATGATAATSAATSAAPAATTAATGGLPSDAELLASRAAPAATQVANATKVATQPSSRGLLASVLGHTRDTANWLANHDAAASGIFNVLGGELDPTRQAAAENLRLKNEADQYALSRQKASDAALEPLRQALFGSLGTQFATNYNAIARNPHLPGA